MYNQVVLCGTTWKCAEIFVPSRKPKLVLALNLRYARKFKVIVLSTNGYVVPRHIVQIIIFIEANIVYKISPT